MSLFELTVLHSSVALGQNWHIWLWFEIMIIMNDL